jgi:hypothetical protein
MRGPHSTVPQEQVIFAKWPVPEDVRGVCQPDQ